MGYDTGYVYNAILVPLSVDWIFVSRIMKCKSHQQRWAAHLLFPPGLNTPDGRLPDDELNTVRSSRTFGFSKKRQDALLTPLLLGLARVCPPTLIALRPALAPQEFLDFLRAVRTFRGRERPLTRDERLSRRGSTLRRTVRLQGMAPQRRSSGRCEQSRGAVSRCSLSRDLTECWLIIDQPL
jgi:hypothetical protein